MPKRIRVFVFFAILGLVVLCIGIYLLRDEFAFDFDEAPRYKRSNASLRVLASAIEGYHYNYGDYPSMIPFSEIVTDEKLLADARALHLTTIEPGRPGLAGLTTPVAYMHAISIDRRSPASAFPFAYHVDTRMVTGDDGTTTTYQTIFLLAIGHDGVYQIQPDELFSNNSMPQVYDKLKSLVFDPTNGLGSRGDYYRIWPGEIIKDK